MAHVDGLDKFPCVSFADSACCNIVVEQHGDEIGFPLAIREFTVGIAFQLQSVRPKLFLRSTILANFLKVR